MKTTTLLPLVLLMSGSAYAINFGNTGPLPTDPVLYGNYQEDRRDTYDYINERHDNSVADAQANNDAVSKRVTDLEKTKLFLEQDVRLYDGKRTTVAVFNMIDMAKGKEYGAGIRLTLKIGSSYEERQLKILQAKLERLEAALSKMEAK